MGLVLIVDDEPAIAESLQDAIASHHIVKVYTSPFALLDDLQRFSHNPVAIMTDYNMPGMDGLTMLGKLRVIGVKCPALLLSGFVTKDVAVKSLGVGVRKIIEKPFEFGEILGHLNEVIREHAMEQSQNLGIKFANQIDSLLVHFSEFAKNKLTPAQQKELFESPMGEPFGTKTFKEALIEIKESLKVACDKK